MRTDFPSWDWRYREEVIERRNDLRTALFEEALHGLRDSLPLVAIRICDSQS
jgi:hypothetical protein